MRNRLKQLVDLCCTVLILPAVMLCRLQAPLIGADAAFAGWSQGLSLIPGLSGVWLRRAFFRLVTARCDRDVCVSFGTVLSSREVVLGAGSYIGHFCSLGRVTIEPDVLIASHVSIMNGCHQHGTARLDVPIREQPGAYPPVTIGRDSWIGEHATVAASVGRHCVIGAGALVLSPVPDYAIAVGVPARVIGDRRETGNVCRIPASAATAG